MLKLFIENIKIYAFENYQFLAESFAKIHFSSNYPFEITAGTTRGKYFARKRVTQEKRKILLYCPLRRLELVKEFSKLLTNETNTRLPYSPFCKTKGNDIRAALVGKGRSSAENVQGDASLLNGDNLTQFHTCLIFM